MTTYTIASEANLNADIAYISANPGVYTPTRTQGFSLNTNIALINAPGSTVTVNGGGFAIDGGDSYGGFVIIGGTVEIEGLTGAQALEHDGARLGGGLFIGAGASVTLSNDSLVGDTAEGGAGGQGQTYLGASGGSGSGGLLNGYIVTPNGFGEGGYNCYNGLRR
jgi:hypothetical protein